MASLTKQSGNRPGYRLMFYSIAKRKCSIWLGQISDEQAQRWKQHVEHLLDDVLRHGEVPCKATNAWLRSLSNDEHAIFSNHELVEPRKHQVNNRITLWDWCETDINERQDVKGSTRETYLKARHSLVVYFTKGKLIGNIRPDDAKRWRIWLSTKGNRRDKERSTWPMRLSAAAAATPNSFSPRP